MSLKLISIQEAAKFLGVAPQTMRRLVHEGKLLERTAGGPPHYDLARLRPDQFYALEVARRTIAFACESSFEQKDELERQKQLLERYFAWQGWMFEVIADMSSGMNYHKKAMKRLPETPLVVKSDAWSSPTKTG